jgi:UDP-N-acetylglucosamine 2-epimerase (non-hydrolysing)
MTITEHARRYLLAEGLRPDMVFKVGSCMKEVLSHYEGKIHASDVLRRLGVEQGKYFVVSAHREENVDSRENFGKLVQTLNFLAAKYRMPLIFSTHPRTLKRIKATRARLDKRIRIMKPQGFFDYNKLQLSAFCVVSDSGTIWEESSLMGFPAITIRNAHERPEGVDAGTLVMTGLDKGIVDDAVRTVTGDFAAGHRPAVIPDYNVENVSKAVLRIILGYTSYVKRVIWGM